MKKQYTIDGRDPEAKGYVKENRMANQHETDKVVEALESFGYKNVEDYRFHLFGRLDDVHGWYLFGVSREDSDSEDFLILGDCLDVLEEPYDKVLGLDKVMEFARNFGSGENVGTAYDAMKEWGVFGGAVASVFVLTIYKDGQFFPEVHRTLAGAVDGAMNDIAEHMDEDEVDCYDNDNICKELKEHRYWKDEKKETVYDIADCRVSA